MDNKDVDYTKYEKNYSDEGFLKKIFKFAKAIGAELVYTAFLLYYVAQKPNCPLKVKAAIYGALGYLVLPLDLIPDITPVMGYSDDATVVAGALALAYFYIDDTVRRQAYEKVADIFGQETADKVKSKKLK